MIVIVDYGLGNIAAFVNVFKKLDIPVKVARKESDFGEATKIILPGVGAFDYAMTRLQESGMRPKLDYFAREKRMPLIGICVGMQILANSSEEGILPGLGYIDGVNKKFDTKNLNHKTRLPHMGWNNVKPLKSNGLFESIEIEPVFYFLHSYYMHCNHPSDAIATADYGGEFVCAVNSGNIYGVQFHPEKSHANGIQLLKNFANLK
jgi:glutamine amidotransferase